MAALEECGPAVPSGTPEVPWVVVEWEVEVVEEEWSPVTASLILLIIPDMIAVVVINEVELLWL